MSLGEWCLFVKWKEALCRCSMILLPCNFSEEMSPWGREGDSEQERAEEDNGIKSSKGDRF